MHALKIPFEVDGLRYVWQLRDDAELAFTAIGSNAQLGVLDKEDLEFMWDIPAEFETTKTTGLCPNSFAVFRKVLDITVGVIGRHAPACFFIRCEDDPRKMALYARYAARHAGPVGYESQVVQGRIYFARSSQA